MTTSLAWYEIVTGHPQEALRPAEVQVSAKVARRRRNLGTGLIVLAVLIIIGVIGVNYLNGLTMARVAEQASTVAPRERELALIKSAHKWNADLFGSAAIESVDPFTTYPMTGREGYTEQIPLDGGLMGQLSIPSIGVNLPIRHGTQDDALDDGLGHMPGSSLPVGGADTHTVLAGHRGLNGKMLLTRLNEVPMGDLIELKVLGETLDYEVDDIRVVEPTNTEKLGIVRGVDRISLITCTPYGINTQRLIVSGHRVPLHTVEPHKNALIPSLIVGFVVFVLLVIFLHHYRSKYLHRLHFSGNKSKS